MGSFKVHQVDAERAYARYKAGESMASIAADLRVTYSGLRKRWAALGFNTARQTMYRGGLRPTPSADTIRTHLANGLTLPQLARAFRVSAGALQAVLDGPDGPR